MLFRPSRTLLNHDGSGHSRVDRAMKSETPCRSECARCRARRDCSDVAHASRRRVEDDVVIDTGAVLKSDNGSLRDSDARRLKTARPHAERVVRTSVVVDTSRVSRQIAPIRARVPTARDQSSESSQCRQQSNLFHCTTTVALIPAWIVQCRANEPAVPNDRVTVPDEMRPMSVTPAGGASNMML